MDNASKALLMVGGVLIALLTLSLLVVMFGNINIMADAQEKKRETQELQKWNAEWESYNKRIMYGSDVLTIVNKAADINNQYMEQPEYQIKVKIEGIDMNKELEENKLSIFECTKITYSENTGRVNGITIKFIRK